MANNKPKKQVATKEQPPTDNIYTVTCSYKLGDQVIPNYIERLIISPSLPEAIVKLYAYIQKTVQTKEKVNIINLKLDFFHKSEDAFVIS